MKINLNQKLPSSLILSNPVPAALVWLMLTSRLQENCFLESILMMWVWRLMLWWKYAIKLLIWPNYGKLCQMIYISQKKKTFYFVIFTYSGSLFPQRELPQPPLSSLCCSPLALITRHCKQGWPSAITLYMRKKHRNDLQYPDASPPWDTLVETVRFTDEVSSQYFVTECLTHSWIRNNRLIDVDQRLRINIRAHMLSLARKPTIKYHEPQHGP